jgi:hypothetical protein
MVTKTISVAGVGGQPDYPNIRRQQSVRAVKVSGMNYIWKICDNN